MKKNVTISIDIDTYSQAKAKIENLSKTIQDLLEVFLSDSTSNIKANKLREHSERQQEIIKAMQEKINDLSKKPKHNFEYDKE